VKLLLLLLLTLTLSVFIERRTDGLTVGRGSCKKRSWTRVRLSAHGCCVRHTTAR